MYLLGRKLCKKDYQLFKNILNFSHIQRGGGGVVRREYLWERKELTREVAWDRAVEEKEAHWFLWATKLGHWFLRFLCAAGLHNRVTEGGGVLHASEEGEGEDEGIDCEDVVGAVDWSIFYIITDWYCSSLVPVAMTEFNSTSSRTLIHNCGSLLKLDLLKVDRFCTLIFSLISYRTWQIVIELKPMSPCSRREMS